MAVTTSPEVVREAVAVFDSEAALQGAVDELLSSGFDSAEVSMLADEREIERKLGHTYNRVGELEDDPKAPRTSHVPIESVGNAEGGVIGGLTYVGAIAAAGAVVASGGTLLAVVVTAAIAGGAGGLIGSILARWIGHRHHQRIQEQLRHGGLLLWVRTWDADHERRALAILSKHSGRDVHVHSLPAG